MKWSTPVSIPPGPEPLDYGGAVLLLGSCFAAHMGEKLRYFQFDALTNPFGVIYHPAPLLHLLRRASENRPYAPEELFEQQGLWRSMEAHSSLGRPERDQAVAALNAALGKLKEQVSRATHVVLTLGSSWGYRYLDTGQLVANCHTLPAAHFRKELAEPAQLDAWLQEMAGLVHAARPSARVILSVSPVRHVRDGLVESQRSKALLLGAVHGLVEQGLAAYFPAYEIVLDELRDYRFFERDLVHPNAVAVDYVWERFAETWIAASARPVMAEVDGIRKALAHRPLHAGSQAHAAFVGQVGHRMAQLCEKYPFMSFDA